MINDLPKAGTAKPAQTSMSNPTLQAAEEKVESQLTPQNRGNYMKVVVAGMRAGMAGDDKSIIAGLKDSKDVLHDCAVGAINLTLILAKESRGTMPLQAMIPAAMTLMLKALDFAERMGLVKVGAEELVQATRIFANTFCERAGVNGQMIKHAMGKVQEISNDPKAVGKMRIVAGQDPLPDDFQARIAQGGGANVSA